MMEQMFTKHLMIKKGRRSNLLKDREEYWNLILLKEIWAFARKGNNNVIAQYQHISIEIDREYRVWEQYFCKHSGACSFQKTVGSN